MLMSNIVKNVMNEVSAMKEIQDGTVQKILKEVKESS